MWKVIVTGWLEENQRTQAYLARKAGINESYLSRCLNDKTPAGERTLRRLELAMDMTVGALEQIPMPVDGGPSE
jgi:transcriptional regulator with XRE-family HTH domain